MPTRKDYLDKPYARIVIPVEDDGFHGEILEFPGCFAQGDTVDEAYSNLESAAESWIESRLAAGYEIPEPSSSVTYSGRIVLRLPRSIPQTGRAVSRRHRTYYSGIERGVRNVSLVNIEKIAKGLRKSLPELFGRV
jgi:antitoxin HicB